MTNSEIAKVFEQIGDILEIKGENVFRIRAYRTAALNVQGLSRQLSDIYEEDPERLDSIPGIGKDLKEKIIEMVKTGELKFLKDLLKEFPPDFIDMLNIQGMGPKKLKKLRDRLGIESMADLEKACREGKLEDIEGMGKKTQEKFLEAIEYRAGSAGRMLFYEAAGQAEEITDYLKKSPNFKKVEPAGSLRRGKETIGDIDILTVAKDAKKAMDHFTSYPEVQSVTAKGQTKSSVMLKSGAQVDLRVIDEGCFGAALCYFTGSKAHNVKLRKIAKAKGMKVSEYGVFKVSARSGKEKFLAGKTEKELYKQLGLDWVPPELREDLGEIEAAKKGKLPKTLVRAKDIKGDLHLHTVETDGRATIEEMANAAKERGYKYIAITDHTKHVAVANGMDEKRLRKHIERIKKADKKVKGVKILTGAEVDILKDGSLDLDDSVLKDLDVVIAAVHSHFSLDKKAQTERVLKAMDNKYVNILAHPTGRLITKRKPMELDLDRIFKAAKENKIFLEINTHGKRIDLNDVHSRRAKEFGASFVISTDAHGQEQLEQVVLGVVSARRGWLQKKDILNAQPLDKVLKALKK